MGWIVVAVLVAVAFIVPLVPMVLQWLGFPSAYLMGFPVSEHWRDEAATVGMTASEVLIVTEREGATLVRERPRRGNPAFEWWDVFFVSGVVGRIDSDGPRRRLRFVSDWHTTFVWTCLLLLGTMMVVMPFFAPELRGPDATWLARVFVSVMVLICFGLVGGLVLTSRRRARRRTTEYARRLGFA